VSVGLHKTTAYVLCAAMAALAGIIHCAQLEQGNPNDGVGYELDAIAAVVIGGTSLSGGVGTVGGTLVGTLIIGIINNSMGLNNVDANLQLISGRDYPGGSLAPVEARPGGRLVIAPAAVAAWRCLPRPPAGRVRRRSTWSASPVQPRRAVARRDERRGRRGARRTFRTWRSSSRTRSRTTRSRWPDVENFLRQRVDLLMISPNEARPLTPVVERAFKSGVPVIVIDRGSRATATRRSSAPTTTRIGRQAGAHIVDVLQGRGSIVEIRGLPGSPPAVDRSRGMHDAIAQHPLLQIIHAPVANWLREEAMAQMEMALAAHPHIDLVYAHNDPMAVGAYLAAKAKGREREMKFIGIDALPGLDGGRQAVADGNSTRRSSIRRAAPGGGNGGPHPQGEPVPHRSSWRPRRSRAPVSS